MAITFDQYQRYKTIEIIVELAKKYYNIKQLNILEVGSNGQLNLGKFLKNENITYSDLSIPINIEKTVKFIEADATNLENIDDNEFDIVISSDVFEHIPNEKRQQFLEETNRVAKIFNLHCFPFNNEMVKSAEINVNEYYKTLFGIDHMWLKEHIDNGLPDINSINDILKNINKNYFMFEHGDILVWEEMTKALSFSEYIPELMPLMIRIEEFYQKNIFKMDIGENNYRKFIVTTNDLKLKNYLEENVKEFFKKDLSERYVNFLYKNIEDMKSIAQLPIYKDKLNKNAEMTLYLDYGNGFSEENKIKYSYSINESVGSIEILENISKNIKSIRFDPIEGNFIILNRLIINSNNGNLNYKINNGFIVDDYIIFDNYDPQIIIEFKEEMDIKWLKIQTEICVFKSSKYADILNKFRLIIESRKENILLMNNVTKKKYYIKKLNNNVLKKDEYIKKLNDKVIKKDEYIKKLNNNVLKKDECIEVLKNELEDYKLHYNAAILQREELKNRLIYIENSYNIILNSMCWKITKPIRETLDLIKKILKSNKYTHLICKGMKCLKRNGIKYTLKKVNNKFKNAKGYNEYAKQIRITEKERKVQVEAKFSKNIKFSIVVPIYNTPRKFLCEMINSCIDQTYGNWELCLADGSDEEHSYVGKVIKDYINKDKRIKYKKLENNNGISENTNECIKMSSGDYIALFDHDDLLHPSALYEYMKVISEKDADFIYCDEVTFEGNLDRVITMHFKPDFAIDNLRANNYICHFTVFNAKLLKKTGLFRKDFDGSQDHDMILRLTEKANKIVHIPKILYYWRSHPNSVAADINSKTYAIDAGKRAVKDHLSRCGLDAIVESSKAFPTIYRLKYDVKTNDRISIIIPNKDNKEMLEKCINSILFKSTYENIEIIIVENNSTNNETFEYYKTLEKYDKVRIIIYDVEKEFNYSAINNFGVKYATGNQLLFLNNDIEIITPNWIEEMLMYSQRKDVGAVGAKLYYSNNTIQHAGIILKMGAHRCAGHCHYRCEKENLGYMGRLYYAQNFSAVTAACLMMKKKIFDEINGFDESFKVAFNDVDLCMRIRAKGYLIAWTPYAEAYHYESISRGAEDTPEKQARFNNEVKRFRERWNKELEEGDPYYNVNLTLDRDDFSLK